VIVQEHEIFSSSLSRNSSHRCADTHLGKIDDRCLLIIYLAVLKSR